MEENEGRTVVLKSSDNTTFDVSESAARISRLVRNAMEDDEEDVKTAQTIHLPRVHSTCLKPVVAFMQHNDEETMNEIKNPLDADTFEKVVTQEWYRQFASKETLSHCMLRDLLMAANYMEIEPLLDLLCLRVTFDLVGKNEEQVREFLESEALTPEQEREAREKYKWMLGD